MMTRALSAALLCAVALLACKKESPTPPVPSAEPAPSAAPPVLPPPDPVPTTYLDAGKRFDRAAQAAKDGRSADVRSLLLPALRAGNATPDELRLLKASCKLTRDDDCLDELKSKAR